MKESNKRILDIAENLLKIDSPSGMCQMVNTYIEEHFKGKLSFEKTNKNALYAILKGKDSSKLRIVTAHVDTLGGIVSRVKDNGRCEFENIGGFMYASLEGELVRVYTKKGVVTGTVLPNKASVHTMEDEREKTLPRERHSTEIRLDIESSSKEDTLASGIKVGDFVAFEPRTRLTENYLVSRFIDNKIHAAIMIYVMEEVLKKNIELACDTMFYFTNFEELGHGISYVPDNAYEVLALDIGIVSYENNSAEDKVTIVAKDSRTPYPIDFRDKLEELAIKNDIDYAIDVHQRYGSDGSLGAVAGLNLNFACIGCGTDASHHIERTNIKAIESTEKLLRAYLEN